jgi:hypothetical protein
MKTRVIILVVAVFLIGFAVLSILNARAQSPEHIEQQMETLDLTAGYHVYSTPRSEYYLAALERLDNNPSTDILNISVTYDHTARYHVTYKITA